MLRWLKKQVINLKYSIKALPDVRRIANEVSYFPEEKRRNKAQRILDNIFWIIKYHESNNFYNIYGLDLQKNKNKGNDYLDYRSFMLKRNSLNKLGNWRSSVILLRDKFLFYKYLKSCGIKVPDVFAVYDNGNLYDIDLNRIELDSIKDKTDFFIKIIDGECASFVKHINNYDEFLSIKNQLINGKYIFQYALKQSDKLNLLNPHSVNTLRIVSISDSQGNVHILSSIIRIGTKKSGNVDNWAVGGLAVGIKPDGYLNEYGFYKPNYGTKTNQHPDTNITFSDYKIDNYQEILEIVKQTHKKFYGIRVIGWDVALCNDGVYFIEGNDNWEISLMQAANGPLRKKWDSLIQK